MSKTNTEEATKEQESYDYEAMSYVGNEGSLMDLFSSIYQTGIYDYFSSYEIAQVVADPITNYETAIRMSNFIYSKNGIVGNSIDYMTSLMCLDRVIVCDSKRKKKTKKDTAAYKKNKELMKKALDIIDDKKFIRNALFTEMVDGIAFFYLETKQGIPNRKKYLSDYEVRNIIEINDTSLNISITSLPWQFTKIIGKVNGRYQLAFNLDYFNQYTGETLDSKLRKYPDEIVKAYNEKRNSVTPGNWVILDHRHTMCKKIKCKDSEPWGRSLAIAAISDVMYKDYFVDTKRNVLDELNNKIIYETFPEGSEKGKCALTAKQQQQQHDTVKKAVMNKNTRGGTSFFSVAAGTKLDTVDISSDIFDEKNESDLNNQISMDMGICASLIGAMSTGNFAAGQQNLEMITAQLYTWVYEWQKELNYVLNANVIKSTCEVEVYYFPTSFVNRQKFFDMMKDLYTNAGGSLSFLIASTGIDPDVYLNILDEEIEDGIFEKYLPHETSWTLSSNSSGSPGRPVVDDVTNNNTSNSKSNNSNANPKPSTS